MLLLTCRDLKDQLMHCTGSPVTQEACTEVILSTGRLALIGLLLMGSEKRRRLAYIEPIQESVDRHHHKEVHDQADDEKGEALHATPDCQHLYATLFPGCVNTAASQQVLGSMSSQKVTI